MYICRSSAWHCRSVFPRYVTSYIIRLSGDKSLPYFSSFSVLCVSLPRKSKFEWTSESSYLCFPSPCCFSASWVMYSMQSRNAPRPFGTSTKFSGIPSHFAIVPTSIPLGHCRTICQCGGFTPPCLWFGSASSSASEYTSLSWRIYAHSFTDLCARPTLIVSSFRSGTPVSGWFIYCMILKTLARISSPFRCYDTLQVLVYTVSFTCTTQNLCIFTQFTQFYTVGPPQAHRWSNKARKRWK